MRRIMLIGKVGCGKTTLAAALSGTAGGVRKTQALVFTPMVMDTPGEYLENRRFYSALLSSAAACDLVGFMQSSLDIHSPYPPGFATMFGKPVIGIVSKIDAEEGNRERAEKFLRWAGTEAIFHVSARTDSGVDVLRRELAGGNDGL